MIEVQDARPRGWFWIDNELIDRCGAQIGPFGLAVYMVLARHANQQRACWPSYETLAAETGMSRRKVIDVVKALREAGLISVEGRKTIADDGSMTYTSNVFTLLGVQDAHSASEQRALGVVNDVHHPSEQRAPKQDTVNKTQSKGESAPAPVATQERPVTPVPKKQRKPPAVETPLPADFTVTADMLTWAKERGIPPVIITRETEKFINTATAKGYVYKNWVAAWRTWMLRIEDFSPNNGNGRHEPTGRVIHEATAEERAERERRRNMPVAPPRRPAA
jgi:hypothetical protein